MFDLTDAKDTALHIAVENGHLPMVEDLVKSAGFDVKDKNEVCMQQVFRVKKLVGRRWGAPNSNYLLVMVSTFVMPFSMDPLNPRMTPGCIMQK